MPTTHSPEALFGARPAAGRVSRWLAGALCAAALGRAPAGSAAPTAAGETVAALGSRAPAEDARHYPFRVLPPDAWVWFNADHSPVGANASLIYGLPASGGLSLEPGRTYGKSAIVPHDGLIVAVQPSPAGPSWLMPFCRTTSVGHDPRIAWIESSAVRRTLRAGVDAWDTGHGLTWRHDTPYWPLPDLATATTAEIRRFVLPATWMTFTADNLRGTAAMSVLFSLQGGSSVLQHWGDLDGYVIAGHHALALSRRDGTPITAAGARARFGVAGADSAFVVTIPPGARRSFTFIVAHYDGAARATLGDARYYYTTCFDSLGAVAQAAAALAADARARTDAMRAEPARAGLNPYRQFLLGHALNAYMFNTVLLRTRDGAPIWAVLEGEYAYTNTLDLTIDQAPMELRLHPWTVRNELDLFASRYTYRDRIRLTTASPPQPGGRTFDHDMGSGLHFWPAGEQSYPYPMAQEELQDWSLVAGLYWHRTGDVAWLRRMAPLLAECLASMQVRDDPVPARRDGLTSATTYAESGAPGPLEHDNHARPGVIEARMEITTYDALDSSLKVPKDNLYVAVKSFATYLVLAKSFDQLGDAPRAAASRAAAALTARSLLRHWDSVHRCFPSDLSSPGPSRIIPAVEPLAFPYLMGLEREVALDGPYAELIGRLRDHLDTLLQPGICLDPTTGAWKLSSGSPNTWQGKVYLAQFVAEKILRLQGPRISGPVDAIHAAFQVLGASAVGWSDQLMSYDGTPDGSRHYPRGVTSFLWLEP